MPYKLRSDRIYVALQRGDGILAQGKPTQMRLFDGMVGNLIDVNDWKGPVVLSDYNMGETCWIELPRSEKDKAIAQMAQLGTNPESPNFRRTTNFVDYKAFASQVSSQCPDFLTKVHEHKFRLPMLKLGTICNGWLKKCKDIKPKIKALVPDVGQITSGNYTVGPGAGDNYPTFGGAGGGYAALGNLTGNLTFTLTGNITETAVADCTITLGGFTLLTTSNAPHYGDPTVGWLVQANFSGSSMFQLRQEGAGTFNFEHIHARRTGAFNANNSLVLTASIIVAHTINLHDLLLDGNSGRSQNVMYLNDGTPTVNLWNTVIWDGANTGLLVIAGNAASVHENIDVYNANQGIHMGGGGGTVRNCTSYGNGVADYVGIAAATGRSNTGSDASGADANWAAGTNNTINAVVGNDVQSVNDALGTFFDITSGGPLDGSGVVNGIAARTLCIRNRTVPGPNGTSRGAAEAPVVASNASVGVLRGSHIAIHSGVGVF